MTDLCMFKKLQENCTAVTVIFPSALLFAYRYKDLMKLSHSDSVTLQISGNFANC